MTRLSIVGRLSPRCHLKIACGDEKPRTFCRAETVMPDCFRRVLMFWPVLTILIVGTHIFITSNAKKKPLAFKRQAVFCMEIYVFSRQKSLSKGRRNKKTTLIFSVGFIALFITTNCDSHDTSSFYSRTCVLFCSYYTHFDEKCLLNQRFTVPRISLLSVEKKEDFKYNIIRTILGRELCSF